MTRVLERVMKSDSLPTMPAAALRVLQLTGDEASLNQLSEMITQDAALSAKVLRAVNSPFYALSQKVSSVQQAVPLLGIKTVKTLVLSFSLVTSLREQREGGFDYNSYWRRSMYSAASARLLAAEFLKDKQEECFVAALLMDMGTVLLHNVLHDQYDAITERDSAHHNLVLLERHELDTTHAEVAAAIAKQWGLPDTLVIPIGAHHGPHGVTDEAARSIAQIIWLAGRCAEIFVHPRESAEAISAVRSALREIYKQDEVRSDTLLTQIGQKTAELAGVFEVRVHETSFEQILSTASQRLIELSLAERDAAGTARDKRRTKRIRRDGKISVTPCARGVLGRAIQMKLRDVSATGIGLSSSGRLELDTQFLIQLPQEGGEMKSLLYAVKRCEAANGLHSIGGELVSVLRPEPREPKRVPFGATTAK